MFGKNYEKDQEFDYDHQRRLCWLKNRLQVDYNILLLPLYKLLMLDNLNTSLSKKSIMNGLTTAKKYTDYTGIWGGLSEAIKLYFVTNMAERKYLKNFKSTVKNLNFWILNTPCSFHDF